MDHKSDGALLIHRQGDRVPEGAVRLTEHEALTYRRKDLDSLKNEWRSWPIQNGFIISGVVAACGSAFVTSFYRRKLKLRNYGRFTSFMPNMLIPGILATLIHNFEVTNDVLLDKECRVCLDLKASAIQVALGSAYPLILAPVISFSCANMYSTYPVPSIREARGEVARLWLKLTRPALRKFAALAAAQAISAVVITRSEGVSWRYATSRPLSEARPDTSDLPQD